MMRLAPILLLVAAAPASEAAPQEAIVAALADSAAGWNEGDLARFTRIYAPDATYASGKEVASGREAIAARYAGSFVPGANTRGRLSFQPVTWRAAGAAHMLLLARWTLVPTGAAAPQSGLTTLLFERRKDGWRIVADHSS